jgi:hypothetical protein
MNDEHTDTPEDSIPSEDKDEFGVPIDFATFILSLSSSAAIHMGMVPHPESDEECGNLTMAKQTIDILTILQEKTNGNLTTAEEQLLGEILYNLRMAFVRCTAQQQS